MTTPEEDLRILQAVKETPITTAVELRNRLQLDVSVKTVTRRLREADINHRVPATKEKLTDVHRTCRLAFARENGEKDIGFWSKVIFTDEKTFRSSDHGRVQVWRKNNTR